jgi:uncharacterized membrane protein
MQNTTNKIKSVIEKMNDHSNSFGARMSDNISATVGSWRFILIQSTIIAIWIAFNTQIPTGGIPIGNFVLHPWDPYPFIFLNLALSFQAAYTAPIIMMSQNRQSMIDRFNAEEDYRVNREAKDDVEHIKRELRSVHQKLLKHQDIQEDMSKITEHINEIKDLLAK